MDSLVAEYLKPIAPQNVFYIGQPWPQLIHYCEQLSIPLYTEQSNEQGSEPLRMDLAIVLDSGERSRAEMSTTLGWLKNLVSERVWYLADSGHAIAFEQALALGFHKDPLPAQAVLCSYSYNLQNYNHARQWNNPQNWANPQFWHLRF